MVGALHWCEGVDDGCEGGPKLVDGSGGGFSEDGLEFGEGVLDGVQVGAAGRQENESGADGFEGRPDCDVAMGGKIFEDEEVAGGEGRHQDLLDTGLEPSAGHEPIENNGCGHSGHS